jgi:hypothetical protein
MMRKILPIISLAVAAAFATPALAEPETVNPNYGSAYAPVVAAGGVAVGTVVGVGLYEGWFGTSAAVAALSAAGAAVVGGVAGVGTIVLIDAAIQPCRGFHALLGMNEHECVDGVYVGDAPRRVSSLHGRRVIR